MAPSRACRTPSASSINSLLTSSRCAQSRSLWRMHWPRIRTVGTSPATTRAAYCSSARPSLKASSWFDKSRLRSTPLVAPIDLHHAARRLYSSSAAESPVTTSARPEAPDFLDEKERAIFDRLSDALDPTELEVQDISGGCGSMYAVSITTEKFKGLPVIKQHRLVNGVLGEDIKSWHGIQLKTKAP